MTTTVTVDAHLSSAKEVVVNITGDVSGENAVLQNGETQSFTVYDDRVLTVVEAEKTP